MEGLKASRGPVSSEVEGGVENEPQDLSPRDLASRWVFS